MNEQVDKKVLGATVNRLAERYPKVEVAETLDELKALGFLLGDSLWCHDLLLRRRRSSCQGRVHRSAEEKASKVQQQYEQGSDHRL